jgi:hypothetical protein
MARKSQGRDTRGERSQTMRRPHGCNLKNYLTRRRRRQFGVSATGQYRLPSGR